MPGLECARLRELIELYVDAELPAELALCVRAHLDACPACRRLAADLEAEALAVRSWAGVGPGETRELDLLDQREALVRLFRQRNLPRPATPQAAPQPAPRPAPRTRTALGLAGAGLRTLGRVAVRTAWRVAVAARDAMAAAGRAARALDRGSRLTRGAVQALGSSRAAERTWRAGTAVTGWLRAGLERGVALMG